MQEKEEQKMLMIDALRKGASVDEADIRKKAGKELTETYNKQQAMVKAEEDRQNASFKMVQAYQKANDQLDKIKSSYEKMAQYAAAMKEQAAGNPFLMGETVRWTQKEAEMLERTLTAVREKKKELENINRFHVAETAESGLGNVAGISAEQRAQVQGALRSYMEAMGERDDNASPAATAAVERKIEARKKEYDVLVQSLGIEKQLTEANMGDVEAVARRAYLMEKASREERKMNAETEERRLSLQLEGKNMEKTTVQYSSQEALLAKLEEREQKRADLLGKTAAGYSAHFQGEKRVYDIIVKRVQVTEKELATVRATLAETAKQISSGWGKQAGLGEGVFAKALAGDEAAINKINEAQQKLIATNKDQANDAKIKSLDRFLVLQQKEIDNNNKLFDLENKRLEKALALKEGYLDVINEMTTSSNLVSDLVAGSSRGLVSLQQMQMVGAGKEVGGAFSRGFATINPFQASMGMAGAAGYTQAGFKGPGSMAGSVAEAYMKEILGNANAEAVAGGPGAFKGPNLERSAFFGNIPPGTVPEMNMQSAKVEAGSVSIEVKGGSKVGGKAAGGLIPGAPSSRDNTVGMLDGKHPIGLATGEFVVNAKATKENLALLQEINSGYAKGGRVSYSKLMRYLATKSGIMDKRGRVTDTAYALHAGLNPTMAIAGDENIRSVIGGASKAALKGTGNFLVGLLGEAGIIGGAGLQRNIPWSRTGGEKTEEELSEAVQVDRNNPHVVQTMIDYQNAVKKKLSSTRREAFIQSQTAERRRVESIVNRRQAVVGTEARLGGSSIRSEMENNPRTFTSREMIYNQKRKKYENEMAMLQQMYDGANGHVSQNIRKRMDYVALTLQKDDERRKRLMGAENGGLLSSSMNTGSSMSIAGGMKIGTLVLNGRVIGQDVSGGGGSEWRVAAQNAHG
jgi:hypothetical protein